MNTLKTTAENTALIGCLIGTAVGDALGLPAEGLSPRRQRRIFGTITDHRLLFGHGMVSDDTEHTVLVAQALVASGGNAATFEQFLVKGLKRWLCGLPAGVGLATLRAIVKLLVGIPASKSGVFSAGNGPAMRSALLGVCFGGDKDCLRDMVRRSTRLTHTDSKAEFGAVAVAVAAYLSSRHALTGDNLISALHTALPEPEADILHRLIFAASQCDTTEAFAASLGLSAGVGGYIYHTVPVALHAALRFPQDFSSAVLSVIACGGDTDTTAAIVGGIVGADVGMARIPPVWVSHLWEPAFSIGKIKQLGKQLADVLFDNTPQIPVSAALPLVFPRNFLFLIIVLYHGLRRLLFFL